MGPIGYSRDLIPNFCPTRLWRNSRSLPCCLVRLCSLQMLKLAQVSDAQNALNQGKQESEIVCRISRARIIRQKGMGRGE